MQLIAQFYACKLINTQKQYHIFSRTNTCVKGRLEEHTLKTQEREFMTRYKKKMELGTGDREKEKRQ